MMVTKIVTISVTKITGLRARLRGLSLTTASSAARPTRPVSKTDADLAALAIMARSRSVQLAGLHHEVLDDRPEGERREELQATHDQDHADHEPDEQGAVRGERAGGGWRLDLGRDAACDRHHRHDVGETAEQHR